MASSSPEEVLTTLTIHAEGPATRGGRIALTELARIVGGFQGTIVRLALAITGGRNRAGRRPQEIVDLVRLDLVAFRSGSAIVELERASDVPLLDDLLTVSFAELRSGIDQLRRDPQALPGHFTPSVVNGLVDLSAGISERNITTIEFSTTGSPLFVFDAALRQTFKRLQKAVLETEVTVVGRLHMGDFDPMALRCRIDTHTGSVTGDFDDDLRDRVFASLDQLVVASGTAELQPDGTTVRVLHLNDIDVLRSSTSKTLDQLAAEQGIRPIESIAELAGEPIDDFDVFFAAIRSAR